MGSQLKLNIIILFTTLLVGVSAIGQQKEYQSFVIDAELSIVDGDCKKALRLYENAFNVATDEFWSKDLYNASICAAKLGQDSLSVYYLSQLVSKGIRLKNVLHKTHRPLKKSTYYRALKEKEKESCLEASKSYNYKLRFSLDSLLDTDQGIRSRKYGYPDSDTIRHVDSLNILKLAEIISEYGFPNEHVIGLGDKGLDYHSHLPHYFVLRHYAQFGHRALIDSLLPAVEKGEMSRLLYAELMDKVKNNNERTYSKYGTIAFIKVKNTIYSQDRDDSLINQMNVSRRELNLDSWCNYRRKVLFMLLHPEFNFGFNESIVIFRGMSKKVAEKRLRKINITNELESINCKS